MRLCTALRQLPFVQRHRVRLDLAERLWSRFEYAALERPLAVGLAVIQGWRFLVDSDVFEQTRSLIEANLAYFPLRSNVERLERKALAYAPSNADIRFLTVGELGPLYALGSLFLGTLRSKITTQVEGTQNTWKRQLGDLPAPMAWPLRWTLARERHIQPRWFLPC